MEKNTLLQYLTCPITNLIFCDPVLADDGNFYEFMAIKNHLSRSNISPITGEKLGNTLIRAGGLKKMTDEFLLNNPEYKTDQFLFKKPFSLFTKEFLDNLKEGKYDKLNDFTSILLNTEIGKETLFVHVCKLCPDDVIKHIIDNSIDFDVCDMSKLKPLHIACRYTSNDVIMHLVKKGVDINSLSVYGESPLVYLLKYKKKEEYNSIILEFLEMGANINISDKRGSGPAHCLIDIGDYDMLKIFIEKGLNISVNTFKNQDGLLNLVQFAFMRSPNVDIISYLIDLNISLDVDINSVVSNEHFIYCNRNLSKIQKQQMVLKYLTKILNKPQIIENFMDNVKRLEQVEQAS
jgi:hypothetical protein